MQLICNAEKKFIHLFVSNESTHSQCSFLEMEALISTPECLKIIRQPIWFHLVIIQQVSILLFLIVFLLIRVIDDLAHPVSLRPLVLLDANMRRWCDLSWLSFNALSFCQIAKFCSKSSKCSKPNAKYCSECVTLPDFLLWSFSMRSRLSSRSSTLLLIWLSSLLMVSSSSTFTADKVYQRGLLTNYYTINLQHNILPDKNWNRLIWFANQLHYLSNHKMNYEEFYWSADNKIPLFSF